MVENDIENNLNARSMQGFHHFPELVQMFQAGRFDRVTTSRGEKADIAVPPVIRQFLAGLEAAPAEIGLSEFLNGQQLYCVDAQALQVGYLFNQAAIRTGISGPG
ncbi:MAG: hypothetical protein BWX80_01661 [Candidatus Hydrogenedentes bacterium ADurb.Bin101]|nr:MAG: hypothetical protein BWX80_01661 [Candidatus Hydrogenedentes bacterium ADurb.Bin101]